MKKRAIILVTALLIVVMAFAACGAGSSGASAVATKFMEAAKSGDMDAMIDCFEPDTAEFVKGVMDMMGEDALNGGDLLGMSGIDASSVSYKVLDEKVEGDTATVKMEVTATVDGETQTETSELPLKKIDGQWYIALDLGM